MRTIVVTGGGRGLGRFTAEKLARLGHRVILTVRRREAGEAAVAEIHQRVAGAQVEARMLDLASLASIRSFARELIEAGTVIDVLLHNAGVMQQSPTRRVSADGFEETLAVNALAPYLLTHELWPAFVCGAAADRVEPRLARRRAGAALLGRGGAADRRRSELAVSH